MQPTDEDPKEAAGGYLSWDSIGRYGQVLSTMLMLEMPPEELRRIRGPALARTHSSEGSPLLNPTVPLRLLLAPDLSPADPVVRNIVNLAGHEGIEVYAHPASLAKFGESHLTAFDFEKEAGHAIVRWPAGAKYQTSESVPSGSDLVFDLLNRLPPFEEIEAWEAVIAWAFDSYSSIHATITRDPAALQSRATRSGLARRGFMSPEEGLATALTVIHHRGQHVISVPPGGPNMRCNSFTWYSGAAQLAMPWYRSVFAAVAEEARDHNEETLGNRKLYCLQGIYVRVRQLLRIHDRLSWLALLEAQKGSDNSVTEEQSELVFDAVSAVNGSLDGMAVWLFEKEGASLTEGEWKSVSFKNLHNIGEDGRERPLAARIVKYAPAKTALRQSLPPVLALASELRISGYHYHPLLVTGMRFPELIRVGLAGGGHRIAETDAETAGGIHISQGHAANLNFQHGVDGFVVAENNTLALPLGFVRSLIRDYLQVLNPVLEAVAKVDGLALKSTTEYFENRPSPYAKAMLDFQRPLTLPSRIKAPEMTTPNPQAVEEVSDETEMGLN